MQISQENFENKKDTMYFKIKVLKLLKEMENSGVRFEVGEVESNNILYFKSNLECSAIIINDSKSIKGD